MEAGLLESERLVNELKKENFGLKMRIYYLQENIDKLTPEGLRAIVLEHAQLKETIQKQNSKSSRELQNQLEELETRLHEKSVTNKKLFKALQEAQVRKEPDDHQYKLLKKEIKRLKSQLINKRDLQYISAAVKLATQKRIADLEKENFDLKIRLAMNSNYDNIEEQNLVEQVFIFDEFMELKQADTRHAEEVQGLEEEIEAMQLENKQMYQELEFARKDLEIAETRTDELKQLYEKELMGSTQQLEMIEKENEEIRAESEHREQKMYQLEQQLRQNENSYTRSQQELQEYRQVAESAIEELQKLRQMLESQAALLTMYQERDSEPKRTKMVSEMGCQTGELVKSPKAEKCDASTSDSVSNAVLEANRKKYQIALKERNDFAISVNNQLDKKLNLNVKLSGSFSFESVSKIVYKKLAKLLTVIELDEKLNQERQEWTSKLDVIEKKYKELEKKMKRLIDHFHAQKDIKRNNEVLLNQLKTIKEDNDKLVQDNVQFTKQNISWQHELQSARSRVHELIEQRHVADGLVKQMHAKYDDAKERLQVEAKKVLSINEASDMEKLIHQMDNALKSRNGIIQDALEKLKQFQKHPSHNDLVIGALNLLEYQSRQ